MKEPTIVVENTLQVGETVSLLIQLRARDSNSHRAGPLRNVDRGLTPKLHVHVARIHTGGILLSHFRDSSKHVNGPNLCISSSRRAIVA